ncbi:aminopeptidase P family protein [candidate division KSB1 bacterium]|nr:aminopeptidase P family protein [candidate division KSB1 bacterium]
MPPLREQATIQQEWLKLRLERVLPTLMRRDGVQMWLIICREYNEDPVFFSLVSATQFAARRRTIYVFFDRGEKDGIERLALGGGAQGGLYTVYRDSEVENRELWGQGQWALLRKLIEERQPKTIAIDISHTHAFSDGLSAGEYEQLTDALGEKWKSRFVRAENLPLDFISIRLPEMMPIYRQMMDTVHWLINRAFSNEVITPDKTTNDDVVWWLRQTVNDMGLGTWFHPTVRVQRPGMPFGSILSERAETVIERGDVLHVDFGITAMRLNTDTQHMGYVLQAGEKDVPAGIKKALANTNRMQDLLVERMRPGRSGNEVLADALAAMKAAGINSTIYTHPIGDHGHGAGPLVGLWDRQQGVPGRGDVPILPNTWFSIELSAQTEVPEWGGQPLWVGQEEDAFIDADGKINWVLARQTQYHLVK